MVRLRKIIAGSMIVGMGAMGVISTSAFADSDVISSPGQDFESNSDMEFEGQEELVATPLDDDISSMREMFIIDVKKGVPTIKHLLLGKEATKDTDKILGQVEFSGDNSDQIKEKMMGGDYRGVALTGSLGDVPKEIQDSWKHIMKENDLDIVNGGSFGEVYENSLIKGLGEDGFHEISDPTKSSNFLFVSMNKEVLDDKGEFYVMGVNGKESSSFRTLNAAKTGEGRGPDVGNGAPDNDFYSIEKLPNSYSIDFEDDE